ncbi:MAG: glycosyltransferase family 2 protein [Alphaproteobacteria bacterium]|nr:glycosyltransferase family 2 protein [Alphaproteobacteria bacterium]MBU0864252.1 glycosyltransferase family 2 protein [Alphaproteobacteria bacterium]MBU1825625.1 glycosyltransferase family 2 protein [Alphaproteobacteria bacterium]
MSALGLVVIGRNEAARLPTCLASLPSDFPIVYIDSGSRDSSCQIARNLGVPTVQLTADIPFSAARARNAGFEQITKANPEVQFVFFIDGDCVLDAQFLPHALPILESRSDCAIVVGAVKEEAAEKNVFGLLAELEWSNPSPGEIVDFNLLGGIMLIRVDDFIAAGGFDSSFVAGEDSELGIRLYLRGRRTLRIASTMAHHAMDMDTFGQWWLRSVRAGQALAHRNAVHGRSELADSRSAVKSTLVYGIIVPFLILVGTLGLGLTGLIPIAAYAFLAWRFFKYYRRKGASCKASMIGTIFGVLGKFANAVGLVRYHVQRARGRFLIVEYK